MKFNKFEVGPLLLLLVIISAAGCINISAETDEPGETKLKVKPNFLYDLGVVRFTKIARNRKSESPVPPKPDSNNGNDLPGKKRDITAGPPPLPLRIGIHESVFLSEEEAKNIFKRASDAAKEANSTGDVKCNITLSLDGSISTFSSPGLEKIDTKSKFEEVTKMPGMRVVKEVRWCNGQGSAFPLGGCSVEGGKSFVVKRFDNNPDLESILWLHEYGHNKNIQHRDDHETAVMHSTVAADHKVINKAECQAFVSR